ncbi:uncharacterized protein KY384_005128 [Bacidia gigantensis]|uniref:uncharacterized protein n=1 Tax=Bacidia gigantensis TaxID=2732470 RepID=UPI001D038459|nr:uncharacterized protein KY384_005128 [Bacidia gigantensis]KAG8529647.1 hypothetical protein KY384_005128 [Bacidia gigantensis]
MASPGVDLTADKGPLTLRSIYPCAAVATLAVVARFTSRKLKKVQWALDDYAVLFCLILTWGVIASLHFCVLYGGGKHIDTLSPHDLFRFLKSIYALNEIYIATTPSIKIAALLMYRRIFITQKFQLVVNIMIGLVFTWWLAEAIAAIWLCVPINGWWDKTITDAKCMSLRSFDLAFALINITFDFFILLLPVNMVWRLQITNFQKGALTLVFLLGGLTKPTVLSSATNGISGVITNTLIWTAAECSVGVISVCLPTLKPLLSLILPSQFGSRSSKRLRKTDSYEDRADSFTRLQETGGRIHAAHQEGLSKPQIVAIDRNDPNLHPYDVEHAIRVTTELELHELELEKEQGRIGTAV